MDIEDFTETDPAVAKTMIRYWCLMYRYQLTPLLIERLIIEKYSWA